MPLLSTLGAGSARGFGGIGASGSSGPVGETSGSPATVAEMFAAGNPAGLYWHTGISGHPVLSSPFQVRYKPYGGKGWINTFISRRPNPDDDNGWAWTTNAGWDDTKGGSDYWLKTVNLSTNNRVAVNNFSSSTILPGPTWGATDFMCTSVNTNTESNLVADVSGNNSGGALPLVASTDLRNPDGNIDSDTNTALGYLLGYFTGTQSGFDFHPGSTTGGRTVRACWYKAGPNGQEKFAMLMHHRGSPQTDHWYVAASTPVSAQTSTYHANIGYRGSTSTGTWSGWDSANIGSWAQNGATGEPDLNFQTAPQRISATNAISIWLSNM